MAFLTPAGPRATIELSTANAVRNPRRTGATVAALMIGVGLVTMMGTGAATGKATLTAALDRHFPADVIVQRYSVPLTQQEIKAVQATKGVAATAKVRTDFSIHDGNLIQLVVSSPGELAAFYQSGSLTATKGKVALSPTTARELKNPKKISVDYFVDGKSKSSDLPVEIIDSLPVPAMMTTDTAQDLLPGGATTLLVKVSDQKNLKVANTVADALAKVSPADPPQVFNPLELRDTYNSVIDTLLLVLLGLLAMAVVIAIVGVANTLSLSVIERRKEHGILRSMGVTKPQLRHLMTVEAILIALVGGLMGIFLGVLSGWSGATILLASTPGYTFSPGWLIIGLCLIVAVLAGILASVLPARGATKVSPVLALAEE